MSEKDTFLTNIPLSECHFLNPSGVIESDKDWAGYHGRRIAHGDVEATPFNEDDVDIVLAVHSTPDGWDGEVCGVLKLKDGRYVSWETFWGPTGDGFFDDAYGGDADIHYAATLDEIVRWGLTNESRKNLHMELSDDV